ncbi:MAG: hypothetical protein OHK0039_21740 [Bacteroidia bacterium]
MDFAMQAALLQNQETLAMSYFRSLRQEIPEAVRKQIRLEFRLEMGSPCDEILRLSDELQPDLLVLGASGSNPLMRSVIGSTSVALIQRSQRPLLLIPAEAHYQDFANIVYATDYEDDDIAVIDRILFFARKQQAHLACVHVRLSHSADEAYKADLLKRAFHHDLQQQQIAFHTVYDQHVVEGLRRYIADNQADLLVMHTHRRSLLGRLMHGSHTVDMAPRVEIPLWIFPMREPAERLPSPTEKHAYQRSGRHS